MDDDILVTKQCRICKQEKSLDDFPKASQFKDGRETRCRPCYNKAKEAARQWRLANPGPARRSERAVEKAPTPPDPKQTYLDAQHKTKQAREALKAAETAFREAYDAERRAWVEWQDARKAA